MRNDHPLSLKTQSPALNAVIMGRKTWESIPPKFRPLKGRLNVILSRSALPPPSETPGDEGPVHASSLKEALAYLRTRHAAGSLGRVFVIGGAGIYRSALEFSGKEEGVSKRVLLTRVLTDFECDTFFPLGLVGDGAGTGWVRRSKKEMDEWVGEEVPEGTQLEAGTEYEFEMWEKE